MRPLFHSWLAWSFSLSCIGCSSLLFTLYGLVDCIFLLPFLLTLTSLSLHSVGIKKDLQQEE